MSQQELLTRVIGVLESAAIPYMLTGSIASSAQGEPRFSHDIDLVVAITPQSARVLLAEFGQPDFYLDESSVDNAIANRSMFNLLELYSGDKADFWLITDSPFDQSRFARRRREQLAGLDVFISTPEDTILQKLYWARESGGSEKQFTDALRVFELQSPALDMPYVDQWAARLHVEDLWKRLKQEANMA